jgi:hypothetical protein
MYKELRFRADRMFQNVKRLQELFQHVVNTFELRYLMDIELELQLSDFI